MYNFATKHLSGTNLFVFQVPVNFLSPVPKSARSEEDLTEYERFYFHSIGAEQGKNSEEDLEKRSAEFPANEYKVTGKVC